MLYSAVNMFCYIVLLFVTVFLLCIVLFIFLVLYCTVSACDVGSPTLTEVFRAFSSVITQMSEYNS
jgi:hypothetical protein